MTLKKCINYFSYILVGCSFYYLGITFLEQMDRFDRSLFANTNFMIIGILGLVYGLALMLIALSWGAMVSETRIWDAHSVIAYAKSSILKYLPGNIMHLVGRNLARKNTKIATISNQKTNHWRMGSATIIELMFSAVSAILISSVIFLITDGPVPKYLILIFVVVSFLAITLLPFISRILRALSQRWPHIFKPNRVPGNLGIGFSLVFLGFCSFTLISALAGSLLWPNSLDPLYSGGFFILAWLIGFVVPGAPGGLGVREAFLVAGLSLTTDASIALSFTIVMRAISILGDLTVFCIGSTLSYYINND